MIYRGFIGPTNTLRSVNVNAERSINWMPSISAPGLPKVDPWLEPTPGLEPWVQLGDAPIRGQFAINGRAFAVAGANFCEFYDDQSFDVYGTVSEAGISGGVGDSVAMCSNGTAGDQVAISAGGLGYIFDLTANTLTAISDPDFITPVYMVVFIDGYFVWLVALTRKFFWSALEDGLTYDPLDVAEVSRTADNLVFMAQSHGQLILAGQQTMDVWADIGSGAIFAPATGGFIEQGAVAPFGVASFDNTIVWLGANAKGHGIVYRLDGYTPKRVSDASTEFRLAQATRLDNAIAWSYQEQGHEFYLLLAPGLAGGDYDTTFCYDVTTGLWHERAEVALADHCPTSDSEFRAHVGRNHCFAFGRHFVGDRQSDTIYRMSADLTRDHLIIGSGL
jgi:hypothetical protein